MKKIIALLTAALLLPASGLAQETASANAVAECSTVYQLTAPYSGVLRAFDWESGDAVSAGQTLFEMETTQVVAPVSGTVRALFAQPGDAAADVIAQYGMLAAIEKEYPMVINASTSGAYNKPENRVVHIGETVYLEDVSERDNEGEGLIIAVQGDDYVVEVRSGEFDDNAAVEVYRTPGCESKNRIGSGRSNITVETGVTGSGVVLRAAVEEGDFVEKGQLLYELAAQDAQSDLRSALVASPAAGAIELAVTSCAQVYKGQLLAKVHDLSAMNVVASVDEMDLGRFQPEQNVRVVFDRYPDEEVFGKVVEISRIGTLKQNATYYDVTIAIDPAFEVLPGMNAVVYAD